MISNRMTPFNTPVLFIIFNRLETTVRVFEAIRSARPTKLFIAADGPRENKPGEAAQCDEVRKVVTKIDWACDVKTLFRDKNLGCGRGPSEAMSWFFSHVEEGIILEDDCLPSPDFFHFCSELLERYRYDNRVMQIGGNNLLPLKQRNDTYSYFFSNHNYIWGWATWRRAWKYFDFEMKGYEEIRRKNYLEKYFHSIDEENYLKYVFDKTYTNSKHTTIWDYQWHFAKMIQAGLAIVPSRNLVVNLGFGDNATHTSSYNDTLPDLTLESMSFPLKHPEFVMADRQLDSTIFRQAFTTPWWRVKTRLKKIIPEFILQYRKALLT